SGVFEASWRSGGASTAELAAFVAFARDPTLQVVEASAVKEFGKLARAPRDAIVHFCDDDPKDGPILRYTVAMHRFDLTADLPLLGASDPTFQAHQGFQEVHQGEVQ